MDEIGVEWGIDRWMIVANADCRQAPDTEQLISRSCHREEDTAFKCTALASTSREDTSTIVGSRAERVLPPQWGAERRGASCPSI